MEVGGEEEEEEEEEDEEEYPRLRPTEAPRGRRGSKRGAESQEEGTPLEDMSLSLYDFCWQRAVSMRTQVLSLEQLEEPVPPAAWHAGYPRWFGPCILGDICGSYHMPEVCRMFERMSPEGRLSDLLTDERIGALMELVPRKENGYWGCDLNSKFFLYNSCEFKELKQSKSNVTTG